MTEEEGRRTSVQEMGVAEVRAAMRERMAAKGPSLIFLLKGVVWLLGWFASLCALKRTVDGRQVSEYG